MNMNSTNYNMVVTMNDNLIDDIRDAQLGDIDIDIKTFRKTLKEISPVIYNEFITVANRRVYVDMIGFVTLLSNSRIVTKNRHIQSLLSNHKKSLGDVLIISLRHKDEIEFHLL